MYGVNIGRKKSVVVDSFLMMLFSLLRLKKKNLEKIIKKGT